MIIVPIGREDAVLQRHAWMTYALIALNVLAFLLFCTGSSDQERIGLIRSWRSTITFLRDRPYLKVPPLAAHLMPRPMRERTPVPDPAIPDWKANREQDEADQLAADLRRRYDSISDVRMAYVPVAGSLPTLITSMFLHAGVLHLVGNMLFLFATAPFVEDAFGRPLFIILYLTGGIVATLAFAARNPASVIPLVGASGAIAGVMGAYLVCFARSRMQFLFVPIIFFPFWHFRFALPALVVLPLWFLEQIVSIPAEGDSGVAVTAHAAGFAYGLLFAGLGRLARGKRSAVEGVVAGGDAREELRRTLDVALSKKDLHSIDTTAVRLLDTYAAARDKALAGELISELREIEPAPRQFMARAASYVERSGDRREAIALLERLAEIDRGTANGVPTLVRLAALRRSGGDNFGARTALQRALNEPELSSEWKRRIDSTLALL